MKTSWNGNIFRVTGPLCGLFTDHRWIPRTKASDAEFGCFLSSAWLNGWVNNHETGDLRRHRPRFWRHCNVMLNTWLMMGQKITSMAWLWKWYYIKWKHFSRYWPFVRGIHRSGPGEFPAQRPVTRSFVVLFDLRLNKRLSKQSWGWWLETQSRPLWRQCNGGLYFRW